MNGYIVNVSPHLRAKTSTSHIMADVLIALMPTLIAAVLIFGIRSALITAVCVATCVACEYIYEKLMKRENTIGDLSAAVTGVILAFNLSVEVPIWQAIFGSIVAIVVVKQLFGGIGYNFANPAITARIVMLLAFSDSMTTWVFPDTVSSATPLEVIAAGNLENLPSLTKMALGLRGGCIGETCAIALVIGGLYLMFRKVITWHTPVAFIGTVFIISAVTGKEPVYQILSGSLLLGSFFMATDYSTTPSTRAGKIIFGVGCGLITVLIRFWGNYPEGVSFAILLMNILTPYIDRWTRSKPLGGVAA